MEALDGGGEFANAAAFGAAFGVGAGRFHPIIGSFREF